MKIKRYVWIISAVLILIIIDQIVKFGFSKYLYDTDITLINNILNLTYIENGGVAFGFWSGGKILIILVNITIITLIINFIIFRIEQLDIQVLTSLSLILAGGIGNLIDRIFRGYVIDYISVIPKMNLPIFNFGDMCVFVGAIMLGISILMYWIKKK